MDNRAIRAHTAQETLRILEQGEYTIPVGQIVSIATELDAARKRSVLYKPAAFDEVLRQRDQLLRERSRPPAEFRIVNATTLHAVRGLLDEDSGARVLALNFASARHPGGGFLKGSQAQEESLARASGLYACLDQFPEMYETNRQFPSCLYTDHLIYSPDVPVFRNDQDKLLERTYSVSFVTAPAVNAGAVRKNEANKVSQIEPVMRSRMEKVLSLAVIHGHEVLVLGAWGCGVFANNPTDVASWFFQHLSGDGKFRQAFQKVVFAVLDRTPDRSMIRPFEKRFGMPA